MNSNVFKVATNQQLDSMVRARPIWPYDGRFNPTKGVVNALVAAKAGVEIDLMGPRGISSLQRGDFVQYWYVKDGKRLGHAAVVVEPVGPDHKVTLKGSQEGVEGRFRTTLQGADRQYAVRPFR
jgi:hypothetical protein